MACVCIHMKGSAYDLLDPTKAGFESEQLNTSEPRFFSFILTKDR